MIYASLGSNLGHRQNNLRLALQKMNGIVFNLKTSIVLETQAITPPGAPDDWNKPFLNMVIAFETDLNPQELLAAFKNIEQEMGRPKEYQKWAPRIIDIDILKWHEESFNLHSLTIPHPEIKNRDFLIHLLGLMGDPEYTQQPAPCSFLNALALEPKLMGIVNVTEDSFSDGGQFYGTENAVSQIYKLANDGASVIDIGAQSTRPGAILKTADDELAALRPVLDRIKNDIHNGGLEISIDTFRPEVVKALLKDYNIGWINDVKGAFDDATLKIIAQSGCKFCLMHSMGVPPLKSVTLNPGEDPIAAIKSWAELKIEYLQHLGFDRSQIIIDPGIGFGKNVLQNLEIIRRAQEFKELGVEILVGHSRKSFMNSITNVAFAERDPQTIAMSLHMVGKVDFLRVHNVKDHMQAMVAQKVI